MAQKTEAAGVQTPTAKIESAEELSPPSVAYIAAQVLEYGQFVAAEDISVGYALAYRKGDPVPASNVALHKYDELGLVEKVS